MNPKWWPIVWLLITVAVLVNPFPVFHRFSRAWLFRRFGKLMFPGIGMVKFSDFWLGDQMTSLGFVFGSLPLFVCTYTTGFQPDWSDKCGNKTNIWLGAFVLAALPLLIRLVQSMRRFADSGLHTHLLNAGKYGLGVASQLCYYLWRHHGGRGTLFFVWIIFNTIYVISAGSWDVWFDMSLLRRRAKHPWLRDELMYSDAVWSYWFAMLYNTLTRFAFVIYIPAVGPNDYLRSFIVSVLEITRRIMWNFFRLENEHIGNVDQYRATREVPLPYALENVEAHRRAETEDDDASVWETVGTTTAVASR
ncbi:EXS-domain-containing protein [Cylindrobasidium torrendii FP15055 ss-10]|uniref:EXS-domain-containing protein n=1 Tax=Cylindrobasidium torrendii FP15055 ss-10 TaxID=1314674 RepID=A0A0D7BM84_9AGAR|nr:EXS-domain-containing protein [Cylindrobasidium torrendii FP15055 ss-10]